MITICSRCKRIISETFQQGQEQQISHGICSQCLSILESKIQKNSTCPVPASPIKDSSPDAKEHD